ncbi:MAG: VOC family protein [Bacteroidota bacterium]
MIRGVSHITFAVADLNRAVRFYIDAVGCRLVARWPRGAYLAAGDLWIALALNPGATPASGETHTALAVADGDFDTIRDRILRSGAREWRENRSEGASVYFLDPDGHRLEVHVGTLASRLEALAGRPEYEVYAGVSAPDTRRA